MSDIDDLVQGWWACTVCSKARYWAFYAGISASFALGLLGGACLTALAWSHLGG